MLRDPLQSAIVETQAWQQPSCSPAHAVLLCLQARGVTTPLRWGPGATVSRWCTGATAPQARAGQAQAAWVQLAVLPAIHHAAGQPEHKPAAVCLCTVLRRVLQALYSFSARPTSSWAAPTLATWLRRSAEGRRCGSGAC